MSTAELAHQASRFAELRRRLLEADPDIDDRTLSDTLEGATDLHEAIAVVVRSALDDEVLVKALRGRIEDMHQRLSRLELAAEAKREAALNAMEQADILKLMAPDFTVSIRINPPSLVITAEAEIPQEFWLPQPAKLNKKGVLDAINAGWAVPGATLSNSKISLTVRTNNMAFARAQLRLLSRRLNPKWIKHRESNGQTLSYIEGWHAVSEANRVFGFDGWDRETVSSQCVWAKPIGSKYGAAYLTRVRITVRAGDQKVIREGSGNGEATAASPGLAHEIAAKSAETDATKRALSTFGNLFGLSLYSGSSEAALPSKAPRSANGQFRRTAAALPTALQEEVGQAIRPAKSLTGEPVPQPSTGPPLSSAEEPSIPPWPNVDPFEEAAARAVRSAAIDKSKLFRGEVQRLRDPGHLRYIAGLACLVCGRKPCHAHHLRFAQSKALGRKVSDEFTVPLCNLHHREVHTRGNEESWWHEKNLSPLPIAQELWATSRHHRGATAIQEAFLRGELPQPQLGREVEEPVEQPDNNRKGEIT